MRIPRITLAVCCIGLACPIVNADDQLAVTKYEISRTERTPAGKLIVKTYVETRYIAADGRERVEVNDGTSHEYKVPIVQHDTNSVYFLDAAKKTYYTERIARLTARAGPLPSNVTELRAPKDLGSKTIQGLACHGSRASGSHHTYWETWKCADPASKYPVEADMGWRNKDGAGGSQSLQYVTKGVPVAAAFFDIPSDFALIKAPEEDTH